MARNVKFKIDGVLLDSEIIKVDRTKLYGSSKKIVKDKNGNQCIISNLYQGNLNCRYHILSTFHQQQLR